MQTPDILIYFNTERFDIRDFDKSTKLIKESKVKNQQFSLAEPKFMSSNIHLNEVEDEIDYFQVGQTDEDSFFDMTIQVPEPSSWNLWPERYKFIGLEVYFHYDKLLISRSTYGILECLGDIGGLAECVYYIGYFLLLPFTEFKLGSKLLSNIFDESVYKRKDRNVTLQERIKNEFTSFRMFPLRNSLKDFFCDKNNLKKKIAKSNERLTKELNLQKFIQRQRVHTHAIMGLLSG